MDVFEEDEIFSLTENLSNSYVDPSNLVTYVSSQVHPIGMENFRQKKKQVQKSQSVPVPKNSVRLARHRWHMAAAKLKRLKDPWTEFDLNKYPTEIVIRHRYNAIKKEWIKDECKVKIEDKKFANGAMRACFRLKKLSNFVHKESWEHAANYVAKCYMDKSIERERYFDDVRLQMDAKLWAEIFNRHNPPKKIDMFQMSILEFVNRAGSPLYHMEHFIEGEYIKYNSNSGFVEDTRSTPQAFSHFTFECSNHELMVVDVQGVGDLYTDPQIHTAKGDDYGDGNLGCKGFALFFSSHVCNHVCRSLGLTEFDLSPNEIDKLHTKKVHNNPLSYNFALGTVCRGSEEFVIGSPTSFCEILRRRVRNMSTCSDDFESEGYESSSSSPMSPHATTRPIGFNKPTQTNPIMIGANRLRTQSGCLDSAFSYDEAASYFNKIDARKHFKPRPSCVNARIRLMEHLNDFENDNEQDYQDNNDHNGNHFKSNLSINNQDNSILGQVHLEMARYHEMGRFSDTTTNTDDYDKESAFFHLKQAANLQVKEAIVTLAKIYLQLPHDILSNYCVAENEHNSQIGFDYLKQCADLDDKYSLFVLAKAYETGVNLPKSIQIDWNLASVYYKKLLQMIEDEAASEDDAGYSDSLAECDPNYLILARLAQMNLKGGHNMIKNAANASILYNEAADKAIQYGKGRIANKYYMLAEEAASQDDE